MQGSRHFAVAPWPTSLRVSSVTGFEVSATELSVQRLFWSSRFSLLGLQRVLIDSSVCRGSKRIVGNAGLFGFTGLYQSGQLGRFRLFATDLSRSVVLVLPERTIVVTPAAPEAFVAHIHRLLPATNTGETAPSPDPGVQRTRSARR